MSTVIKAGDAAHMSSLLSTVDLADHLAEAKAVVDAARREASQILNSAENESGQVRQSAHDAGTVEGFEFGVESGRIKGHEEAFRQSVALFKEEREALTTSLDRLVDELESIKKEIGTAARRDVLAFAIKIAERLTYAIGELNHESAKANLERALTLVGARTDVIIRVHPSEVDAIRSYAVSLLEKIEKTACVGVVEDESLAPGGCVVENENTQVDASLETQIDELVTQLMGSGFSGDDDKQDHNIDQGEPNARPE
ncbi:MAG: FliH/SctL family protein [Planctomycetota bacterium]|jgi:flagellar assembly protein FliH